MHVLGLSFGSRMGNSEVLVKEALMGAEEYGAEVAFVRSHDLDIRPCRGCYRCVPDFVRGGTGKCVIKDDFAFLEEQVMQCDAVILGCPVYVLGPPGPFKIVCDRIGPRNDPAFVSNAKKLWPQANPDERALKRRVAGFISVGGATTRHWLYLGLPLMHMFTFPLNIRVVDQMEVSGTARYPHVVVNDQAVNRARELGRRVAQAAAKLDDEVEWMGDEPGVCPVCHSRLVHIVGQGTSVECPICGIRGELTVFDGKIAVSFEQGEIERSRLLLGGKLDHFYEIQENHQAKVELLTRIGEQSVTQRLSKYKGYAEVRPSFGAARANEGEE